MSKFNLIAITFVIAATTAFTGYSLSHSEQQVEQVQAATTIIAKDKDKKGSNTPRTATTTLPSMTNNAWEMNEITLSDTKGIVHSLSDWKGKVIMLNFWASWCAPCQFEIPRFVKYQEKFADKGLQIVGLGLDKPIKLSNVERSLEMNYPTLVIPEYQQEKLLNKWGNKQNIVPYTVIIAKNGTMEYIHRGSLDDDAFNNFVLPLLK